MRKISGKYRYNRRRTLKINSKYSKAKRQKEKLINAISNFSAIVLVIILIILVLNLTLYRKISTEANPTDIAALNISYNDFAVLESLAGKYNIKLPSLLAYYFAENNFFTNKPIVTGNDYIEENYVKNFKQIKSKYNRKSIEPIEEMLDTVLDEIVYFPIPKGFESGVDYIFGNTWGTLREYGGERTHQGADIADTANSRGRIPIVSMTDGQIKHIGWNELGGYRVGILTESGNYYYYAHLSGFAQGLVAGSEIKAGQLIGFMGDTGYSKKEGTTGNFIVHLHIGIAYNKFNENNEFWVNPYIFLRHIEENRLILD